MVWPRVWLRHTVSFVTRLAGRIPPPQPPPGESPPHRPRDDNQRNPVNPDDDVEWTFGPHDTIPKLMQEVCALQHQLRVERNEKDALQGLVMNRIAVQQGQINSLLQMRHEIENEMKSQRTEKNKKTEEDCVCQDTVTEMDDMDLVNMGYDSSFQDAITEPEEEPFQDDHGDVCYDSAFQNAMTEPDETDSEFSANAATEVDDGSEEEEVELPRCFSGGQNWWWLARYESALASRHRTLSSYRRSPSVRSLADYNADDDPDDVSHHERNTGTSVRPCRQSILSRRRAPSVSTRRSHPTEENHAVPPHIRSILRSPSCSEAVLSESTTEEKSRSCLDVDIHSNPSNHSRLVHFVGIPPTPPSARRTTTPRRRRMRSREEILGEEGVAENHGVILRLHQRLRKTESAKKRAENERDEARARINDLERDVAHWRELAACAGSRRQSYLEEVHWWGVIDSDDLDAPQQKSENENAKHSGSDLCETLGPLARSNSSPCFVPQNPFASKRAIAESA